MHSLRWIGKKLQRLTSSVVVILATPLFDGEHVLRVTSGASGEQRRKLMRCLTNSNPSTSYMQTFREILMPGPLKCNSKRSESELGDNGSACRKLPRLWPAKMLRLTIRVGEDTEEYSWEERSTPAQLRTDMARLNGNLHRIKAVPTGQCECGEARETVEHFLLRCPQWDEQRRSLREDASTKWDGLSVGLGGKSTADGPNWEPNLGAVQATIQFTLTTGRFDN